MKTVLRFGLLTLIVAGIVAYFLWLSDKLTFELLKENHAELKAICELHPVWSLTVYFLGYLLMAALSLPGATIITLAGGAVFGFLKTLIVVSFASSIGATLAFLSARFILRDYIEHRFSKQMKVIQHGITQDGWRYLMTLRMVPVFPFFVINLAMGLTRMSVKTFYIVSQISMLPGTIVYVNAGTRLGEVQSPQDAMTAQFVISFAVLALFPWITKRILKSLARFSS